MIKTNRSGPSSRDPPQPYTLLDPITALKERENVLLINVKSRRLIPHGWGHSPALSLSKHWLPASTEKSWRMRVAIVGLRVLERSELGPNRCRACHHELGVS